MSMQPWVCVKVLSGHKGPINSVKFNGKCEYCVTGGTDKRIRLWNPYRGQMIKEYIGHGYEVFDVEIIDDNSKFASGSADKQVFLWDVLSGQVIRKFRDHKGRVNSVVFNEDGQVLISGSYDRSVKVWDMRSRSFTPIQTMNDFTDSVTSVQTSKNEILTASVDGCVRNYDIRKGKLFVDSIGPSLTDAKFTTDEKCVSVGCLDNTIRLLDKASGKILNEYSGHVQKHYMLKHCLSNDDKFMISGSEDTNLYIWNFVESNICHKLSGHLKAISSVVYHNKEMKMLSASYDGTVRVWEYNHHDV